MSYTAEVQGKAERFRAYAAAKMTRPPSAADHVKRDRDGLPPFPPGSRVRYDVEQIAFEGAVSGAALTIAADAVVVTKVAFYAGPVDSETVIGSIEVGAAGDIAIAIVEVPSPAPVAPADPIIVDE